MKVGALICTLNEARYITARLQNLSSQKLPDGVAFEIHVLDNGSTDETPRIARSYVDASPIPIKIHELPPLGKCGALFWGFEHLECDFFLMTDANTVFALDVLAAFILAIDRNSRAGLFIGNTRSVRSDDAGRFFLSSAAKMPARMRGEMALGLTTGANGACYCVKRSAVFGIWNQPTARNDDFVISIYAASHAPFSFVPNARAYEAEDLDLRKTWKQKYRDALGHHQAVRWILHATADVKSRISIAFRLLYWALPPILFCGGVVFGGYYFAILYLLLILMSRKARTLSVRIAALISGYAVGFIKPPATQWLPSR